MNVNKDSYLSLGSNIISRSENLNTAITLLADHKFINVIKKSSIYESEPLYYENQKKFLNMVVMIDTKLDQLDLLKTCNLIERKIGRRISNYKNRERIIDIDILTFSQCSYERDNLIIPHPRIHERKFVLMPWAEIDPKYFLFNYKKNVISLLNCTKDKSKVIKL